MAHGSTPPPVIRLGRGDVERYVRVRLRMLTLAPWAFGATPEDDEALDAVHMTGLLAAEHHATFAIELGRSAVPGSAVDSASTHRPDLVASASLTRRSAPKFAHRAHVWGVFVEPAHRSQGLGRALMGAVISHARGWEGVDFLDLGVSARSPGASRLYESLGFQGWGREPEATEYEGRRYDEIRMTLRLR